MEGIVYENDNQVDEMIVLKRKDIQNPRVELLITSIET